LYLEYIEYANTTAVTPATIFTTVDEDDGDEVSLGATMASTIFASGLVSDMI